MNLQRSWLSAILVAQWILFVNGYRSVSSSYDYGDDYRYGNRYDYQSGFHRDYNSYSRSNSMRCPPQHMHDYGNYNPYSRNLEPNSFFANKSTVSAYDPEHDMCCAGKTYRRWPNSYSRCCGSEEYDVTRQKCCSNKVYDIKAGFLCCGSDYYDVSKAKCCLIQNTPQYGYSYSPPQFKLLEFPPSALGSKEACLTLACCGSRLYDSRNSICCPKESSHRGPGELRMMDKVGNNTGCCQGRAYDRDNDTCDFPSYLRHNQMIPGYDMNHFQNHHGPGLMDFCGSIRYNQNTHVCCRKLTDRPTWERGSETGVLKQKTTATSKCCGTDIYDTASEICCNGSIHKVEEGSTKECCGQTAYNADSELCCDDQQAVGALSDGFDACCGESATLYNSSTQMCCNGTMSDIPDPIDKRLATCCASSSGTEPTIYNINQQKCCDGILYDAQPGHTCCGTHYLHYHDGSCCGNMPMFRNDSSKTCCWGNMPYDTKTQLCCKGQAVNKIDPGDTACCGKSSYNYATSKCCTDHETDISGLYPIDDHSHRQCCGSDSYDPQTHQCCAEHMIISRSELCCTQYDFTTRRMEAQSWPRSSLNSRCCGLNAYNPNSSLCCNGTVVPSPGPMARCCGSNAYNQKQQLCCADQLHPKNEQDESELPCCCGREVMDPKKEICCRGTVHTVQNPEQARCCYSDTPDMSPGFIY